MVCVKKEINFFNSALFLFLWEGKTPRIKSQTMKWKELRAQLRVAMVAGTRPKLPRVNSGLSLPRSFIMLSQWPLACTYSSCHIVDYLSLLPSFRLNATSQPASWPGAISVFLTFSQTMRNFHTESCFKNNNFKFGLISVLDGFSDAIVLSSPLRNLIR